MKTFVLEKQTRIDAAIEDVWHFFSSPKNLRLITPPYMKFQITRFEDREIYEGMPIEYRIRPLLNIPVRWVTEIQSVDRLRQFVDVQVKGPFKLWRHTHLFDANAHGVVMKDRVEYAFPLGFLGQIAGKLVIHGQLQDIFTFREKVIGEVFGSWKEGLS